MLVRSRAGWFAFVLEVLYTWFEYAILFDYGYECMTDTGAREVAVRLLEMSTGMVM